jgi:aspartate-semialdehyde dehydrogenase
MKSLRVGVIGATGLVGQAIVEWLLRFGYSSENLKLFASRGSEGQELRIRQQAFSIQALAEGKMRGLDAALFATDAAVSQQWIPIAQSYGVICIDNSAAFRQDPSVPLVIPEINSHQLAARPQVVASPNCSTILALLALAPLHHCFCLENFTACTYQAVSGSGTEGLRALEEERKKSDAFSQIYADRIEGNVIASIGTIQANGFTDEEEKLCGESRKILALPELEASATCVRVPVERAHSIAIQASFEQAVDVTIAEDALRHAPGLHYVPFSVPTPLRCAYNEDVYVGRLRKHPFRSNSLWLWVVGDQLWKGAALNVVQILNAFRR